jgi:hypothetical protein
LATTGTPEKLFASFCKTGLFIVLARFVHWFELVFWSFISLFFLQGGAKDPFRYIVADFADKVSAI